MPSPLGLSPSFGFGDRLGLATPGHIAAVHGTGFAPIFAQQSVRENARTGRTPQQVMDDARRHVEAAGWDEPWGADADHLKSMLDIPAFVQAGYTFFTVDPGEHVDNTAGDLPLEVLRSRAAAAEWERLSALYLGDASAGPWGAFTEESLLRASAKYGRAIAHAVSMFECLSGLLEKFDFEVSVDETDSPTTPLEHFFIVNELTLAGVRFTSLAPRFTGRFEKGVDYIGDLESLDRELAQHAAVTSRFGSYKLSLHSGSDKFSVYPLMAKYWGERLHVKTAGTSYLEALRVLAQYEPDFFLKVYSLARQRYETDRHSYHVSAELGKLPTGIDLPLLLEDFHAREILHVTFGSALSQYGTELRSLLARHADAYQQGLEKHFKHHLSLLRS